LRFDRCNDTSREELSNRRLVEVWNAALNTKLHQQRLSEVGLPATPIGPDNVREFMERLPPVPKVAFRRFFPTGVTNGEQTTDWRYQSTAGTTDRMTVIADFRKRDYSRSSELRVLQLAIGDEVGVSTVEIPPNACNVVCGLMDTAPPSLFGYVWHALRRRKLLSHEALVELRGRFERQYVMRRHTLLPLDPLPAAQLTAVLDRYLEQIARLRPAHLRGFPVYLLWLADRCLDRGVAPTGLKAIGPYGGLASPEMVNRICQGLSCRFVQKYGTSELGVVAGACGHSIGMHIFEDLFHVEMLRFGKQAAPGEIGRLAITDLINRAMPLIRYDVGDVGRLHVGPCPCGRRTARLEVLGRGQEILDAPGGVLTASAVADTAFSDFGVSNFRLEEIAPGSFEAAFVARPSSSGPKLGAWGERFNALHGGLRSLRSRIVPFIQPESSGKYRFVFPRTEASKLL
jgi:phenylacetate-coenzyme A ligase PaaK-like adenylate-forming protein